MPTFPWEVALIAAKLPPLETAVYLPSIFFQHASTGWLALLGLVVPLAIYLWNRRPGRVVQVGSLRWLEAAANRRLRSLKPEQLLLFLVRAAMVGLLALALAGPTQWLPQPPTRGQVLLGPEVTTASLAPVRSVLDSLRKQGYELRQLRPELSLGLPIAWNAIGLQDANTKPEDKPDTLRSAPTGTSLNVWSAVRQVADSLPARPLVVVATPTLASFSGSRLPLPKVVRWLPLPGADSLVWPVAAWQPRPDSLVLLQAQGSETGVRLQRVRLKWPTSSGLLPGLASEVRVDTEQKKLTAVENGRQRTIPLLTKPLRMGISYDASHAASAKVLTAALRAVGSALPLAPTLTVSTTTPALTDSLDWLFWLREGSLPEAWRLHLAQGGGHLWQEATATAPKMATGFVAAIGSAPLQVLRLDTTRASTLAAPYWPTATGKPLLTALPLGQGTHYQFRTRLDPTWSELAESPDLPAMLLPLFLPVPATTPSNPDPRRLDLLQLSSGPTATASAAALTALHRDLTPWFVLAAGVLFGVERLLSAYRTGRAGSMASSN